MRIHTDVLTSSDFYRAARVARVDLVDLTEHKSQSRARSFDVKLEGESRRRPMGGGPGYAATWDQWGVFLAVLFDFDPLAICGSAKRPTYANRGDFHTKTSDRFVPGGILPGRPTREQVETPGHVWSGAFRVPQYANDLLATVATGYVYRVSGSYWPADAHGDHTFRYSGTPGQQRCTKCSAVQRWDI